MKHNHNHDNAPVRGPQLIPVHFEYSNPTAVTVCIAGTFNHWQPASKPMHRGGNGHWIKESALLPGTYEYCFVVDGQWIPDPLARETTPNPFGGTNSIIRIAVSPEAGHLIDAENLPLKNNNPSGATI